MRTLQSLPSSAGRNCCKKQSSNGSLHWLRSSCFPCCCPNFKKALSHLCRLRFLHFLKESIFFEQIVFWDLSQFSKCILQDFSCHFPPKSRHVSLAEFKGRIPGKNWAVVSFGIYCQDTGGGNFLDVSWRPWEEFSVLACENSTVWAIELPRNAFHLGRNGS